MQCGVKVFSEAVIAQLHHHFAPFEPLEAGDPAYVDCREARGKEDILTDLGKDIKFNLGKKTCQLYTGHRGAGKSTELLRLGKDLEASGFYVVYFAAELDDIDLQDAEYVDILNACARNIFENLRQANIATESLLKPLNMWWDTYFPTFKKILPNLEDLNLTVELPFAKFSTALKKGTPNMRQDLRRELEGSTPHLIEALNEFIINSKNNLPESYKDLVIIVDNLDRITYKRYPENNQYASNYEKIFIGQGDPLKSLSCHVIYTFPLPLVYSSKGTNLADIYDNQIQVLPMIAVRKPDGEANTLGILKMKEIVRKRVNLVQPDLFEAVFASEDVLEGLCLMSGGYVRGLLQLVQRALLLCDTLPITEEVAIRAIDEARDAYYKVIQSSEWEPLGIVAQRKRKPDERYVNLLLNRCILEYRTISKSWYDVHPTILGIDEFKETFQKLEAKGE